MPKSASERRPAASHRPESPLPARPLSSLRGLQPQLQALGLGTVWDLTAHDRPAWCRVLRLEMTPVSLKMSHEDNRSGNASDSILYAQHYGHQMPNLLAAKMLHYKTNLTLCSQALCRQLPRRELEASKGHLLRRGSLQLSSLHSLVVTGPRLASCKPKLFGKKRRCNEPRPYTPDQNVQATKCTQPGPHVRPLPHDPPHVLPEPPKYPKQWRSSQNKGSKSQYSKGPKIVLAFIPKERFYTKGAITLVI